MIPNVVYIRDESLGFPEALEGMHGQGRPCIITEIPRTSQEAGELLKVAQERFPGQNLEGFPVLVLFARQDMVWAGVGPSREMFEEVVGDLLKK